MTHLTSTSPSSPQQQQQQIKPPQLVTLLPNQRPQEPNNSLNQNQHEQFNINSNNNKPLANTNNTDQTNDHSNRNSFPHRPTQHHHQHHHPHHHQYPQQQQHQQQQNYFGPNDRHFTPENNKNRISRFDRDWPQQQQETFASNGNQQSRTPAKRPYQIDKPYANHQNSRFNNNTNGRNSHNKSWRFNKNQQNFQQNSQRGFHHNQQAKTGHLNNNSEHFQNDDNQVTSVWDLLILAKSLFGLVAWRQNFADRPYA